jgi:hypothetical protein
VEKELRDVVKQETLGEALDRAKLLGRKKLRTIMEPVPEWQEDGEELIPTIRLRQLTGSEAVKMTKEMDQHGDDGMYIILVYCAIDENGHRLLTMEDVPALKDKSFAAMNRLQHVCLRLNGMGGDPKKT